MGDNRYASDQSARQTMGVYKYGGSLVLDPIPTSAAFVLPPREVVVISGTLTLDGHNPEGAIVYIQDEDTANFDDLLTAAYVNSAGRFKTSWLVEYVDPNDTVEIQAVFEGNALYHRLDEYHTEYAHVRGTRWCRLQALLKATATWNSTIPLSFEQAPRVLIVPSIDSYDDVQKHIFPVQEGITLLTAMLEREYKDGNWNVDFEVMGRGQNFVELEPDIIVNLVTRGEGLWVRQRLRWLGTYHGYQTDTHCSLLNRWQDQRGRGLYCHARVYTRHRHRTHL